MPRTCGMRILVALQVTVYEKTVLHGAGVV